MMYVRSIILLLKYSGRRDARPARNERSGEDNAPPYDAGVLEADGGSIVVDGANITSGDVSEEIFYLPDDPYFFPNASMEEMILFYKKYYPRMDAEAAAYMAGKLNLETKRPLRTFSKGMKRQAFLILALCAGTKYLLCDEVFDGLDPIVTEVMKTCFVRK